MFKNYRLTLLIFSSLIIAITGRYYNATFTRWLGINNGFHVLRFVLYLIVPFFLNLIFFKFKWSEIGIRRPRFDRKSWVVIALFLVLTPLIILTIKYSAQIQNYYSFYANSQIAWQHRALDFFNFTVSNLLGWEFLHRSLLLFGILNLLKENLKGKTESILPSIAILWVTTFEVLYHLIKPDLESIAMLIASPLFSWLALRTGSLWPPLMIHCYIELIFIWILLGVF